MKHVLTCLVFALTAAAAAPAGAQTKLLWGDTHLHTAHSTDAYGSGNLFIVSNGVLYTPSLSDGCLGGVMRMQIINLALENGIKVYECSLNPQNLLAADELFFTNASRGVQWVVGYRTKRYTHRMALHLTELLVKKVLN